MRCPRRAENPSADIHFPGDDKFTSDDCCSYCGSLNPETVMKRIEAGDVQIIPTDKNYKAYVRNQGGENFKSSHRTDSNPWKGWGAPEHTWVTEERGEAKFYYPHMTAEQQERFIELVNEKKMKIGIPGHFYVLPYFIKAA